MFKLESQLDDILLELIKRGDTQSAIEIDCEAKLKPLLYYCPHGGQERFINLVDEAVQSSKVSTVLLTCANGWGKTTTSIHIMLNIILGPQNGWFDKQTYKYFPFPKLCWYVTTSSALKGMILPEIYRLAPKGSYTCHNQGKPTVSMIQFSNGWQINFFTTDQGIEQFESATVGLIIADEPISEPIYKALKSRKRMGNLMLMPMTPLDCEPFIIDEVVAKAGNGDNFHITGSVYEASRLSGVGEHCGVRGHLDSVVIDKMVSDYDIAEKEARVYGRFMYFSERIYGNFKETITVVSPEQFPVDTKKDKIYHIVDPHDGRPCAGIYMALKESGRVVIFSETPRDHSRPYWEMKDQVSIDYEVSTWDEIEKIFEIKAPRRIIDQRFGFQRRGGTNLCTLFADAGRKIKANFIFSKSYKNDSEMGEIAYGHKIVRTYFEPMEDGYSKVVIWDCCHHVINGIKHYIRKKPRTVTELNKALDSSSIIEKYKDFNDVLRYGLVEISKYSTVIEGRKITTYRPRKKYNNDPLLAVLR